MPAKFSGSEGTDVARKVTDIRIFKGLSFQVYIVFEVYECLSWAPLDGTHTSHIKILTFINSIMPICYQDLCHSEGKLVVDFRSIFFVSDNSQMSIINHVNHQEVGASVPSSLLKVTYNYFRDTDKSGPCIKHRLCMIC